MTLTSATVPWVGTAIVDGYGAAWPAVGIVIAAVLVKTAAAAGVAVPPTMPAMIARALTDPTTLRTARRADRRFLFIPNLPFITPRTLEAGL